MKKFLIACLLVTSLLTGCGSKQEEVPVKTEYVTYQVDTGNTVALLMETQHGYSLKGSKKESHFTENGDVIADFSFADTAEVLRYTEGLVPSVMAGHPCFDLATDEKIMKAIILSDNTSMVIAMNEENTKSVSNAIELCTIYCY